MPWEGDRTDCYTGPAETEGIGQCRGGHTNDCGDARGICENEVIPAVESCDDVDNDCDGQVDEEPHEELCDYVDNDCDGEIDEGLRNPCGNCEPCVLPGVHRPPIVACGPAAQADAGAGEPVAADAGPASECDLPPSECDGVWVIYWSNGICVDGACQWEQGQVYCGAECVDGGCPESFT